MKGSTVGGLYYESFNSSDWVQRPGTQSGWTLPAIFRILRSCLSAFQDEI